MKVFDMPDKSKSAIVKGIKRVKITEIHQEDPYFTASIEDVVENEEITDDIKGITSNLKNLFAN